MARNTSRHSGRLYRDLARRIADDLAVGAFASNGRLPGEREMAQRYAVGRGTVREAVRALEILGLIEVRVGSGAHAIPTQSGPAAVQSGPAPLDVAEARYLFEGEVAALAASNAGAGELADIEALIAEVACLGFDAKGLEAANRRFHVLVGQATRNQVIAMTVNGLWSARGAASPALSHFSQVAPAAVKAAAEDYNAILTALRDQDPQAARSAMRAHLAAGRGCL